MLCCCLALGRDGNLPVHLKLAAADHALVRSDRAHEIDPALGCAQGELLEHERRAGPARHGIESVAREYGLAVLGDVHGAQVQALEQDIERRGQQGLDRRCRGLRRRSRRQRRQHDVDAVEIQVLHLQRTPQQTEEAIFEPQRLHLDREARRRILVLDVVQLERTDQRAARTRNHKFARKRHLRALEREARARFGQQQPGDEQSDEREQDREREPEAFEPGFCACVHRSGPITRCSCTPCLPSGSRTGTPMSARIMPTGER